MTPRNLQIQDRIEVEKDGEELEVWNFLNVTPAYQFRGGNPTKEEFPDLHRIEAGGGAGSVDYVTTWVAEELWHDLGIDLDRDRWEIEVVDVESDEVAVL